MASIYRLLSAAAEPTASGEREKGLSAPHLLLAIPPPSIWGGAGGAFLPLLTAAARCRGLHHHPQQPLVHASHKIWPSSIPLADYMHTHPFGNHQPLQGPPTMAAARGGHNEGCSRESRAASAVLVAAAAPIHYSTSTSTTHHNNNNESQHIIVVTISCLLSLKLCELRLLGKSLT